MHCWLENGILIKITLIMHAIEKMEAVRIDFIIQLLKYAISQTPHNTFKWTWNLKTTINQINSTKNLWKMRTAQLLAPQSGALRISSYRDFHPIPSTYSFWAFKPFYGDLKYGIGYVHSFAKSWQWTCQHIAIFQKVNSLSIVSLFLTVAFWQTNKKTLWKLKLLLSLPLMHHILPGVQSWGVDTTLSILMIISGVNKVCLCWYFAWSPCYYWSLLLLSQHLL